MTALKSKTSVHSFMNGSCLGCGRKRSVLKNEVLVRLKDYHLNGVVQKLPMKVFNCISSYVIIEHTINNIGFSKGMSLITSKIPWYYDVHGNQITCD